MSLSPLVSRRCSPLEKTLQTAPVRVMNLADAQGHNARGFRAGNRG
jgi:hypothetical protein